MVKTEREGGRPVNRPDTMGRRKRRLQRLIGKKSWFKKKRRQAEETKSRVKMRAEMTNRDREKELQEKDIEAVLFIPYTPGSELCKLVQEVDDEFVLGTRMKRIKVVERIGSYTREHPLQV